jgi:hypothetical protein
VIEPIGVGPCEAATVWSHVIVATLTVFTTAFTGYLAFRVSEAKLDRELKYRQMELQLEAAEHRIEEVITERKVRGD